MWSNSNYWATVLLTAMVWGVTARDAGNTLSVAAYQHTAILDQRGDFVMRWTPEEESLRVEIQVATKGWAGLGFSPNGGMRGADITLGWIDSHGELHVHDRYAHGETTPVVDHSQDMLVEGGYQNDTHTVIRFSRPWNTCDKSQDMKLSGDTMKVIWAFGEEDPVDEMVMERHAQRGVKSIYLKEPGFASPPLTEDIEAWDIRAPNVSLPSQTDTVYWCKLYTAPDYVNGAHIIGFEPLISKDNLAYVHHILLYTCIGSPSHLDKWAQHDGVQCYTSNMPPSWYSCKTTYIAWAVGSEGEMWPDNVGLPIGGGNDPNYFMLEVHYDNPRLMEGVVDDSGLRLLYTKKLRQYDAGVLSVGHVVQKGLVIPPGQAWRTIGHCGSPCLEAVLPLEGVKVIQVFQHAHLLGRGLTLRHIRGHRELPIIAQDLNYDFNYQISRRLKKEVTVLPGDSFILECLYDSSGRTDPTFGGPGSRDEMCLAFLLYYPKVPLTNCESHPALGNIYRPLGVKNIQTLNKEVNEERERKLVEALLEREERPAIKEYDFGMIYKSMAVHEPSSLSNKTLYDIFHDKKTWRDKGRMRALQKLTEYGSHRMRCRINSQSQFHDYEYPHFTSIKALDSECSEAHESQVYHLVPSEVPKEGSSSHALQPAIPHSLLLGSVSLLFVLLK
ncbi:DBH-like monooxygenase protein 1 isoform X2 [Eriocheir sinensis]|uniref:DBH-like monooxygenase protein 1 isoform X2 n=1 Tax=Eriocheir sinensis TaxID=95602 RepID=UPI0021C80382|nr:DBH-like monooxygenase protein 1 isoform X2 [Eriocheir sinensis]